MADVDQRHDQRKDAFLVEIALNELAPAVLFRFRDLRKAVARQVNKIVSIHVVEVDRGGFSRRR